METLGDKLRALRGKVSQADAAEKSGISQQQWSKLERNLIQAEDSAVLGKIADAYLVDLDYLRGVKSASSGFSPSDRPLAGSALSAENSELSAGSNAEPVPLKATGLVYVDKVTGAHLAAGSGEVVYDFDNVEKSHSFRVDWMQEKRLRPERCKVWSVRGDSMEPRYSSGDVVLIDMSDREPRHGKVFALVGDEGLRIKQLRRGPAGWEMHSFNPDQSKYPPEPIVSDNYAVIGRVRWHAGDED